MISYFIILLSLTITPEVSSATVSTTKYTDGIITDILSEPIDIIASVLTPEDKQQAINITLPHENETYHAQKKHVVALHKTDKRLRSTHTIKRDTSLGEIVSDLLNYSTTLPHSKTDKNDDNNINKNDNPKKYPARNMVCNVLESIDLIDKTPKLICYTTHIEDVIFDSSECELGNGYQVCSRPLASD